MPRRLPMPESKLPALIRTDFSDDAAWEELISYLLTERFIEDVGEMMAAYVAPIDDRQYEGMTIEELLEMVPNYDPAEGDETYESTGTHFPDEPDRPLHAYIVDTMTLTHPERPILAVNFFLDHGEHFRLAAGAMVLTEANLSIGNLGFNDYSNMSEPDGIAREL